MAHQEQSEEQITPDRLNMILLEFLFKNPQDFWNINEISQKSANKTLKNSRVKKSINYFKNKKFVVTFAEFPADQQKKIRKERIKDITSESYQITQYGKDIYEKIVKSCLDPITQSLLS